MNLQDMKELMKEFNDSDIYKLSIEMDDVKLKLEKVQPTQPIMTAPPALMPTAVPSVPASISTDSTVQTPVSVLDSAQGTPVKSPVVGVFYCASAPDAPAFVKLGDKVQNGQSLCIIEDLKIVV